MRIDKSALKWTCKNIIETILCCLPNAYKGTVYEISPPPEIIAKRIASGVIDKQRRTVSWGLPERSDYNPPGKAWIEYRDKPGRPLEAMAWCVENQKSWTAEKPGDDSRSVRLQVEGVSEDYYHMEPVLIRKDDLYFGNGVPPQYPKNHKGETIWKGKRYIVAAIIKIHFRPHTIRIDGPETEIIERLSRSLGTELLSYQLRQQSVEVMRQVAQDKIDSCNILAHSLRNAVAKSGVISSLIKLELGFLRNQWERVVLEHSDKRRMRKDAVRVLNKALEDLGEGCNGCRKHLTRIQNRFLKSSPTPEQGEKWVRMQIEERWNQLLAEKPIDEELVKEIHLRIQQLKRSLYLGKDPDTLAAYDRMPDIQKKEWTQLIYGDINPLDSRFIDKVIEILEDPCLHLVYQDKSRKSLVYLKTLAQIIGQLEQDTNFALEQVLKGSRTAG